MADYEALARTAVTRSIGHCVPDGHWCTAHDAMRYGQSPVCSRFVEAEEIAEAALRMAIEGEVFTMADGKIVDRP